MTRHTRDLKQQIERVLHWEQSSHWRTRDFTHLSNLVFYYTHQRVDAHSLQNFWQSSVVPSPDSLDTLARFVDYDDWADFCTRNFYGEVAADGEMVLLHAPMWEIPMRWVVAICWFSVIASVIVALLLVWKH
jgi:hypothetical protein